MRGMEELHPLFRTEDEGSVGQMRSRSGIRESEGWQEERGVEEVRLEQKQC